MSPPGLACATLDGLSCVSGTWCMAVGSGHPGRSINSTGFSEVWNGSAWTVQPIAGAPAAQPTLSGVSCVASSFCVAVGAPAARAGMPLLELWNGVTWALQSLPGAQGYLSGVACLTTKFCVAVGGRGGPHEVGEVSALVELWNGAVWRGQAVPQPGYSQGLSAVSCAAAAACTAVGNYYAAPRHPHPGDYHGPYALVERWDGRRWLQQQTPNLLAYGPPWGLQFRGVSCPTDSWCMAVGEYGPGGQGFVAPFVERWNGGRWHVGLSGMPPFGTSRSSLSWDGGLWGVSCATVGSCVAVGVAGYADALGNPHVVFNVSTLLGSRWNVKPTGPAASLSLQAVSCVTVVQCTAVGGTNEAPFAETDGSSTPSAVA